MRKQILAACVSVAALLTVPAPASAATRDDNCMSYQTWSNPAAQSSGTNPTFYFFPGLGVDTVRLGLGFNKCNREIQVVWKHSVCIHGCPDMQFTVAYRFLGHRKGGLPTSWRKVVTGLDDVEPLTQTETHLTSIIPNQVYNVAVQQCRAHNYGCKGWSPTVAIRTDI